MARQKCKIKYLYKKKCPQPPKKWWVFFQTDMQQMEIPRPGKDKRSYTTQTYSPCAWKSAWKTSFKFSWGGMCVTTWATEKIRAGIAAVIMWSQRKALKVFFMWRVSFFQGSKVQEAFKKNCNVSISFKFQTSNQQLIDERPLRPK